MGANVSTNIQKVKQSIQTDMSTECKNSSEINNTIQGLNISIEGARCGDITVSNNAVVEQTCDLSSMAKTMAEAVQGSTSKQLQSLSLGGNVNTSIAEREIEIKQKLDTKCGSKSAIANTISNTSLVVKPWCLPGSNIFQRPTCFPAECGDINFLNNAGATQQCVAKVLAEAQDKVVQTAVNDQTTQTIGIGIGGFGGILILIVGGIVIFKMMKKGGKSSGSSKTSSGDSGANIQSAIGGVAQAAKAAQGVKSNKGGFVAAATAAVGKVVSGNKTKIGGGRTSKAFNSSLKGFKLIDGIPLIVLIIVGLVLYTKYRDDQLRR